jgi:hypothetical protein
VQVMQSARPHAAGVTAAAQLTAAAG